MRRITLILSLVVLLAPVSVADAEPFPGLLGGGYGYLSSFSSVSTYFNVGGGQLIGAGGYLSASRAFCGISTISAPTTFLTTGFLPDSVLVVGAPYTDLYLLTCVKFSGISEHITIGAFDAHALLGAAASPPSGMVPEQPQEKVPQELMDALKGAAERMVNGK